MSRDDPTTREGWFARIGEAWDEGQSELYEFADSRVREWRALGVVDDHQVIGLMMLLHEMEKNVYYERRERGGPDGPTS